MVVENYNEVRRRVDAACRMAGRNPEDVTLIAVSKTKPVSMIRELVEAGVRDFGENHAQELVQKTGLIQNPLNWHFIGNLQTNKVKYVVGKACLIHSINSQRLLEAVSREAAKKGLVADILLEVNIAGEATKEGAAASDAIALARSASAMPNINVRGLMAICPPTDNPDANRPYFAALRNLSNDIAALKLSNVCMAHLSMGMTNDFEAAIAEGATMVRVGTAIFGGRH